MNAPLHDRLRNQLGKVPLGRGKSATAEGLDVLDKLAACPVLAEETAKGLRELIAATRLDRVDRVEFKRRLAEMPLDVAIGPVMAPRRGPRVMLDVAPAASVAEPQETPAPDGVAA